MTALPTGTHNPYAIPFTPQPGLAPQPGPAPQPGIAPQVAYPLPATPQIAYAPPAAPQPAYPPPPTAQPAYPPAAQPAYPPPAAQPAYPPPEEPPIRPEEAPTPPELFGAPGLDLRDPEGHAAAAGAATAPQDTPRAEAQSPEQPPSPVSTLDPEAYPPARCGAIAARLALEEPAEQVYREERLDAEGWERVHEHWLDRIDAEVARGRGQLQAEYDAAYLGALESDRGALTPDTYAALAEAAERDAIEEELQARKLPEDAWPHIHRVWLGRLLGDLKLAKEVRARIASIRAALP
jgi:hypothetical protein